MSKWIQIVALPHGWKAGYRMDEGDVTWDPVPFAALTDEGDIEYIAEDGTGLTLSVVRNVSNFIGLRGPNDEILSVGE